MTPNKDQQKEQLFCSLFVLVLQPGDVHELRGSRLAACVFPLREKHLAKKVAKNVLPGPIVTIKAPFSRAWIALQYMSE